MQAQCNQVKLVFKTTNYWRAAGQLRESMKDQARKEFRSQGSGTSTKKALFSLHSNSDVSVP